MAKTGIFHHFGTFLLLAAAILLLITTISAPVINSIPILKVRLTNDSSVSFGTFGHCILDTTANDDWCTGRHIGYNPAFIMSQIDDTTFTDAGENTSKALTRVMVLHPVACGLAFIAFLLSLGAGFIGSLFASIVAGIAFIVTVVVMACDFTLFAIVRNHVNKDGSGSHAYYAVGMWTVLAAMVCLFLATIVVLFTCCSSRMHRQHEKQSRVGKHEAGYVGTERTTKRRFWQRRSRY